MRLDGVIQRVVQIVRRRDQLCRIAFPGHAELGLRHAFSDERGRNFPR